MDKSSKIYIAGHRGLAGSAIMQRLISQGYTNLITRTHSELDLKRQSNVEAFFEQTKPEYVFLAAAKVGGIWANNTYPADFIYDNLCIQNNIVHFSWKYKVKRLLFLGSSCIYPKECPQPMKEKHLLTSSLEPTNEPYAIAKIAGIKLCQSYNRQYNTNFLAAMPTNLFGPNDNFDIENSHVLPALIRKFHMAIDDYPRPTAHTKEPVVTIWGTGKPRREFLHSSDLADACVFLMTLDDKRFESLIRDKAPLINVGVGKDITITELALLIKEITAFNGQITFDSSKPDGTFRKLLDVSKLNRLGWRPQISLKEGIRETYHWARTNGRL